MMKWIGGGVLAVLLAGFATFYGVTERELTRMWGGLTEVAEPDLSSASPSRFVITGASVLAPDAASFLEGRSVVVDNGVIEAVLEGPEIPSGLPVVEADGLFLVPGFTDSHVHLWESENDLLLYLANGVTSVRDMNGSDEMLGWREEIANGRPGPDLFVTAPQLGTFGRIEGLFVGWTQNKTVVRSRRDIQRAISGFARSGYDAVKSSSFLTEAHYNDLGEVARASDVPLTGHIPVATGLQAFFAAGHAEVAHVEEIAKALDREFGGYGLDTAEEYLAFVRSRSDEVAERIAADGIAVTSTLFVIDSIARQRADVAAVLDEVALAYANPGITEGSFITDRGMGWLPDVNIYRADESWDAERRARSVACWEVYGEAQHLVFEALLRADVTILAGTDTNVPPVVPGFSLHDEFVALRDAGMTPAEVLLAATRDPAIWEGRRKGQVSEGYEADLVLLRADPLDDIRATRAVETVIKDGRIYPRGDLDAMLEAVKAANDRSRTTPLPL